MNYLRTFFYDRNKIIALILWGLLAAIVYWLSVNVIWVGDDMVYQYIIEGELNPTQVSNPKPIETISDVFNSQYCHYFFGNGRVVAHILVQIFCGLLGQTCFGIINAVAWVILIYLVILNSKANIHSPKVVLTAICLICLTFDTIFGPSNQIGYIWMGILVLAFIKCFLQKSHVSKWLYPFVFLFGALCGNAQETYGIGISCALLVYIIQNFKRVSIEQWLLSFGFGLGLLCLCLSPATISRALDGSEPSSVLLTFCILMFSPKIVWGLLIVLLYKKAKQCKLRKLYIGNSFYFNVLIGCAIFNLVIGITNNRQLFGIGLMSVIIMLSLFPNGFNRFWSIIISLITITFVGFQVYKTNQQSDQIIKIKQLYKDSTDGKVYFNVDNDKYFIISLPYSPVRYIGNCNEHYEKSYQMYFSKEVDNDHPIQIYPTSLKDVDLSKKLNTVLDIDGQTGNYVYIQSVNDPVKFYISRKLLGLIDISDVEIMFDYSIIENDSLRVTVKTSPTPLIRYGSVVIKKYQ